MKSVLHPLEMLTGEEIERAVEIVRASGRIPDSAIFAHIVLHEAGKDDLALWKAGELGSTPLVFCEPACDCELCVWGPVCGVGSGKLGTPCERMQRANFNPAVRSLRCWASDGGPGCSDLHACWAAANSGLVRRR